MKFNFNKISPYILVFALFFTLNSCQDMLETSSNRVVFEEDYKLNDPDNPFYAISGILAQVQKIADNYVLLGELRGDLMITSDLASVSLKEINNFQVSADNDYINKLDYYSIINNCNYALQQMDTALVVRNQKVMLPAYAEIKTIRAWTYFQMVQIFGKATYFTQPILDLESSLAEYPTVTLDDMVETLIQDLLPYNAISIIDDSQTPDKFMPVSIMLGDLYLYQNKYKEAAQLYYNTIYSQQIVVSDGSVSKWINNTFETAQGYHAYSYGNEVLASIKFSSEARDFHSKLVNLSLNDKPSILPAPKFIDFMSTSTYFHADKLGDNPVALREGDLRGNIIDKNNVQTGDAYFFINLGSSQEKTALIFKYFRAAKKENTGSDPANNLITEGITYSTDGSTVTKDWGLAFMTQVPIYRTPELYLRFAEALNRDGKPTLAFAVLKSGLTSTNINNQAIVNPSELGDSFTDFQLSVFDNNIPMAAHGRGLGIMKDQSIFIIPDYTGNADAKQDSINWVEDRILEEMSAETSFEGNRFFDLMRISHHRPNHPEYMAEKVAAKYDNSVSMKAKLMDMNAWFLP